MIPLCVSYIENDAKSIDNNAFWNIISYIKINFQLLFDLEIWQFAILIILLRN